MATSNVVVSLGAELSASVGLKFERSIYSAFFQQPKIYRGVIEDVIKNVRESFLNEGVDEQVLQELKQVRGSLLRQRKQGKKDLYFAVVMFMLFNDFCRRLEFRRDVDL